jgi:hypothetical protein
MGMGFAQRGGVRATVPKRRERRGGPVQGQGQASRTDKGAKKKGLTVRKDEASAAQHRGHPRVGTHGPHHRWHPQGTRRQ